VRETPMNTALRCRLLSLAIETLHFVERIDTEEVDGSNPFGPTISSFAQFFSDVL
jgi:hypothetical protein